MSEYVNTKSKLKYLCANGHTTETRFNDFQRGYRCMKCFGSEKYTLEYVKNYFKERGCELLSTNYINNNSKLKYLCINGHTTETSFDSFKNSGTRCRKCAGKEKYTLEYVKNYFKERGCTLLSTNYVNNYGKLKYICENDHTTEIIFNSFQQGKRCRYCLNKTEKIVFGFLQEHYKNVLSEARFDWCKGQRHLPFDFVLEEQKVIIEVDGRQHFDHIRCWKNDIFLSQERDVYKMKCAIENGYRFVRIFQEDVFHDTIDWQPELLEAITSDEQIIYISKDPVLYESMNELFIDS